VAGSAITWINQLIALISLAGVARGRGAVVTREELVVLQAGETTSLCATIGQDTGIAFREATQSTICGGNDT